MEQFGDLQYFGATVIDDPQAELTAKFERVGKGVTGDHFFPYDEVHVVIKGAFTVRTTNEAITARAGEVIYLPMRSRGVAQADDDVEMVSVTYPPQWQIRSIPAGSTPDA